MKPCVYSTKFLWILFGIALISVGYADIETQTLGDSTKTITESFSGLTKFLTAGSYITGLAFTHNAIFKFKQHK